jgi:hypothetical protein
MHFAKVVLSFGNKKVLFSFTWTMSLPQLLFGNNTRWGVYVLFLKLNLIEWPFRRRCKCVYFAVRTELKYVVYMNLALQMVNKLRRATYGGSLMFCWPCIVVHQYSEINVMHVLFNLLRIKGLYMFRALLAHPQEALHKEHLVYCLRVMLVGCTNPLKFLDFKPGDTWVTTMF